MEDPHAQPISAESVLGKLWAGVHARGVHGGSERVLRNHDIGLRLEPSFLRNGYVVIFPSREGVLLVMHGR